MPLQVKLIEALSAKKLEQALTQYLANVSREHVVSISYSVHGNNRAALVVLDLA